MSIDLFLINENLYIYNNYWATDLCKLHSNPYKNPVRELLAIIYRGRNRGSA